MYSYDEFDERLVRERVAQFASQIERRISGALTEDEFRRCASGTGSICNCTPICCASPFPMAR